MEARDSLQELLTGPWERLKERINQMTATCMHPGPSQGDWPSLGPALTGF